MDECKIRLPRPCLCASSIPSIRILPRMFGYFFAISFASDNGRLTFGSMDQVKTARIKTGTPYKLIFTANTPLTNTAGLFYTVLADAVDAAGNKIDLIVE